MRTETIKLKSIDLAAVVQAVTDEQPLVTYLNGNHLAQFEFSATERVKDAILRYEQGLCIEARKLLTIRTQLYRRIRGGGR